MQGATPVLGANQLHRSLDWDAATLDRLATDLFEARTEAKLIKPAAVREVVRKLNPAVVEGERAKGFVRHQRETASPKLRSGDLHGRLLSREARLRSTLTNQPSTSAHHLSSAV